MRESIHGQITKSLPWMSLVIQWSGLWASTAGAMSSIWLETKIPQAAMCSVKVKKQIKQEPLKVVPLKEQPRRVNRH